MPLSFSISQPHTIMLPVFKGLKKDDLMAIFDLKSFFIEILINSFKEVDISSSELQRLILIYLRDTLKMGSAHTIIIVLFI